ncbi:helix-turn-helix transcriptional regulator [Celerinatantimonas sp. YJH-8]|uniref:helix-turn-helix transcriptional regulator n=1 Tax=Celerinatantimonas sp. YJH-8 TaxID=3228714 RepID=UPI0038C11899
MDNQNLYLLGDFLRRKRESLAPELVGIVKPVRSRTPGLRREDVADRAGISAVWYSKIERGKISGISRQTLATIADALLLTTSEKQYLYKLAINDNLPIDRQCRHISTESRRLLDLLNPLPAMFLNDYFDIIACNQAYQLMCGVNINALITDERNYVLLSLFNPEWQKFMDIEAPSSQKKHIMKIAGCLRNSSASRPHDPILASRIQTFCERSDLFKTCWEKNHIQPLQQQEFTYNHQTLGSMTFKKQIWWNFNGDSSARLNVYHPQDHDALLQLTALYQASA